MRLVRRKTYRAFPELDHFDDATCDRFMWHVASDRRYKVISRSAMVLAFVIVGSAGLQVVRLVTWKLGLLVLSPAWQSWLLPLEVGLLLACTFLPAAAAMIARDIVLRHFLRRRFVKVRCPTCGYSLLGQRLEYGWIRCPECGRDTSIERLKLCGPEDLIPPDAGAGVNGARCR